MRRIAASTALWLTIAICASDSGASAARLTATLPLAGSQQEIALAGSQTLLASRSEVGWDAPVVIRSLQAGRPFRSLLQIPLPSARYESFSEEAELAASSTRLAALANGYGCIYKGSDCSQPQRLLLGALQGPFAQPPGTCPSTSQTLSRFPPYEPPPEHTAVAVAGNVVAYDSFRCVIAEDTASDLRRVLPLDWRFAGSEQDAEEYEEIQISSGWETRLRAAGRLIAYLTKPTAAEQPASAVVYDIDQGRALYSVTLPVDFQLGERLAGPTFDLQSDGTLLLADAATCRATVSTISRPTPRPLGIRACAVRRLLGDRALLVVPRPHRRRALAWSNLLHPAAHPIAELGPVGAQEATPADMNETSVAFALIGCRAPVVYRVPFDRPGTIPAPARACPVRLARRRATLGRTGLRVKLGCPLGCKGVLIARFGTPRQLHDAPPVEEFIGGIEYRIAPHRSKVVSLLDEEATDLTRRTLARRLRRQPDLRVELTLRTDTPYALSGLGLESDQLEHIGEHLILATATERRISLPIVMR